MCEILQSVNKADACHGFFRNGSALSKAAACPRCRPDRLGQKKTGIKKDWQV